MRITGKVAGPAYKALQADIAERVRALADSKNMSLREISNRVGMSPPTAGNYIRYPESISSEFIWSLADSFPELRSLKAEVIAALCKDAGLDVPEVAKEGEQVKRLRSKVLELQGLTMALLAEVEASKG